MVDMGHMVESMILGYLGPKICIRFYFEMEKFIVLVESDST
jgi:hypothetical protein